MFAQQTIEIRYFSVREKIEFKTNKTEKYCIFIQMDTFSIRQKTWQKIKD